jgi:hypothetical protein
MTANPPSTAPDGKPPASATPSPPADADDPTPPAPASGHAATDTIADAADEEGAVKAARRMPEPDSLGG